MKPSSYGRKSSGSYAKCAPLNASAVLESSVRPGNPEFMCLLGILASPVRCTCDPVLRVALLVTRTRCV